MDLVVEGRHALFFDDDATSAFVNSREALVPWNSDGSLLIDRYDVRHLLDRIPPRPTAGARRQRLLDDSCDAVALAEIDCERYRDLPPSDEVGVEVDSETRVTSDATGYGAYQAVPFSYGDKNLDSHDKTEYSSDFRPPFEVPDFLLSHLPPTEKLHQIMARTAMFVNEHGRQSEFVLRVKQGDNPTFGFLMPDHHLHAYFQYLIDHPQILKHYTDSPKKEEEKSDHHTSEAGALSLLGSVYGTGDDDDATLKKENKETEPLNLSNVGNATVPVQSEHGESPSVVIGHKEATKLPFSAGAKEKVTLPAKKAFSGNVASVAASRKTGDGEQSLTAEKGQSSQQKGAVDLNPSILEPPSFLKRTIEKIVEFIVRNGKQFEAILIDQDKNIGRFPFLLPTNQYHSCYLKTLEEAYELKLQGKSLFDQKSDEDHHGRSKKKVESHVKSASTNDLSLDEPSEGGYFDPQRKDKFKMTLFGQKKDSQDQQPSKAAKQHGLSADETAAIVLAATRGLSPINTLHKRPTDEGAHLPKISGATVEEAAASIMAATRGSSPAIAPQNLPREDGRTSSFSSLQGSKLVSRFASNGISGKSMSTGLSASTAAKSDKRNSHGATNDVTVATVIAKSVALAASSEADSSEAGLTKEQKLKAERLKRAKMFASLIKSGSNCMGESVTSASNRNSSMEPPTVSSMQNGTDSDTLGLEREGSSAPFATEVSNREHDSRKKHYSHHPDDFDEDLKHNRKKRHTSHYIKNRSSQDKEARHRHKHHISSSDEHSEPNDHRHRKSSEHRRRRHRAHHHSSEDGDSELNVKWRRKHHSHSERKRESKAGDAGNYVETSKGPSVSSPGVHPSDSTEIPNDLRAKIRAMLLENL